MGGWLGPAAADLHVSVLSAGCGGVSAHRILHHILMSCWTGGLLYVDVHLCTLHAERPSAVHGCVSLSRPHAEPVSCCAWMPDGQSFLTGSVDKNLVQCNINGEWSLVAMSGI